MKIRLIALLSTAILSTPANAALVYSGTFVGVVTNGIFYSADRPDFQGPQIDLTGRVVQVSFSTTVERNGHSVLGDVIDPFYTTTASFVISGDPLPRYGSGFSVSSTNDFYCLCENAAFTGNERTGASSGYYNTYFNNSSLGYSLNYSAAGSALGPLSGSASFFSNDPGFTWTDYFMDFDANLVLGAVSVTSTLR